MSLDFPPGLGAILMLARDFDRDWAETADFVKGFVLLDLPPAADLPGEAGFLLCFAPRIVLAALDDLAAVPDFEALAFLVLAGADLDVFFFLVCRFANPDLNYSSPRVLHSGFPTHRLSGCIASGCFL